MTCGVHVCQRTFANARFELDDNDKVLFIIAAAKPFANTCKQEIENSVACYKPKIIKTKINE